MSQSGYSYSSSTNNWGYPLYLCDCCPYGYHIDLDFVRYCESISKDADRTGSIKRRRDRRRQRKSMEVLLGLETIADHYHKQLEPISPILETENRLLQKQDSFDNVIDDFEKTFQRSNNKLSNNLPDVTAVSDARSPAPGEDRSALKKAQKELLEGTSDLCPNAIIQIRAQMARSLERTRQLEEQIKQLPALKIQISNLEDENERLLQTIDRLKQKDNKPAPNNKSSTSDQPSKRIRSCSFSCTENQYENGYRRNCKTPSSSTKTVGVSCSVLSRTVGVGNQTPSRRNASTATDPDDIGLSDKWLSEKLKFLNDDVRSKSMTRIPMINKGNQTPRASSHNQETQTPKVQAKTTDSKSVQTDHKVVTRKDQGTLVKPKTSTFGTQKSVESYNIGVSDDTITDVNCDKCDVVKMSVAVGPELKEDQHVTPISLASLSFPRSKSFNLGSDKMSLTTRRRSISVQYQYKPECSTKGSQYEPSNVSRSCQKSVKTHAKGTQYESKTLESSTQFDETFIITSPKKDSSTETEDDEVETKSIGCNTSFESTPLFCTECRKRQQAGEQRKESSQKVEHSKYESPRKVHHQKEEHSKYESPKKVQQKNEDHTKYESPKKVQHKNEEHARYESPRRVYNENEDLSKYESPKKVSKIPKPHLTPTSERKNFRRQDTYTKINTIPFEDNETRLSGLDLSRSPTSATTFDKVRETLKFPDISSDTQPQNESNQITNLSNSESEPNLTPSTPSASVSSKPRKKAMPSKEMQGAMKVLNDSLLKQSKLPKNHRAVDIVQQEWFKISGVINSNPLDVEDYLDAFEDMSSMLLDCIVNMVDASGNTAMHYAVSHGNFDVVSILLDSKVCDINKPNKAGYTSVMLVSLAEVASQTHANVIRRLFQMADVNRRAKLHGQTALMLAVSHGKLDMVKMLLEAGADINIQDDDGSTALMCAAEHGHIEIVKHFLSQPDCDSTITDVDGSSALKIAMEADHHPIGVLLYAHERSIMSTYGYRHKKKSSSPKTPSSPLSIRHSHSALSNIKSSK